MSTMPDNPTSPAALELVVTRVFDAPRELVFKAWTTPDLMAKWWGPAMFTNPVCQLDARPGGAIQPDDGDFLDLGHGGYGTLAGANAIPGGADGCASRGIRRQRRQLTAAVRWRILSRYL